MSEVPDTRPLTPDSLPPIPPIAAEPKAMESPVMVRTVEDKVQPTSVKQAAEIEADILMTEGQRDINRTWEYSQRDIARVVTYSSTFVASMLALSPLWKTDTALMSLADKAFMFLVTTAAGVIGYYYARTNTHKTGGVQRGDTGR